MNAPLSEITIYTPIGVIIPNGNSHTFPITDSCERNATLMNDDYIKLSFSLPQQVIFPAFAFIRYDGNSPETNQYFFLKEDYLPADKGGYFEYEMTFVSFANMLSKSICHRHIEVTDTNGNVTETWDEPEINLNATLEVMADVILQSIHQAALRLPSCKYTTMLKALIIGNLQQDTSLLTYSFSGETIYNVLSKVADMNEVEWYIDHETTTPLLHIAKCERYDTISLTDHFSKTGNHLQLYRSGGLLSCEYSQKWTDIPQYLIPYGSERNMTRKMAIANVAGAEMYVSYGKRLRLNRYDDNGNLVDYKIKDENGNTITIHAGEHGEIENEEVTTGIEIVEMFDDVYPRCHYQVVAVSVEGSEETPKYVITAQAIDEATGNLLTGTQMVSAGLMPITLQEGQTLTIVFESGYLNGREFEVNDRSFKVSGKASWNLILSIMAEGGDEDDAPMIPFGTFIPRVGDKFAMFGMEMPSGYIANAKQELAQKAYDKMLEIEQSRPEVKCTADPNEFGDIQLVLGQRISVQSDIFGTNAFVSRVTSFSHSLTTPNVVTFKLASSRVVGRIAEIQQAIADRTNDIKGLEQRTINISRRGWRDATEMADKLETLAAEMMLVGVEKYQFVFTSSIYTNDTVEGVYTKKFQSLVITAGTLQHTQKPYIDYSNKGVWNIPARNLTETQYGNGNTLDPDTSYYIYAVCEVPNAATNPDNECEILLSATALTGTQYLLMGILSSEFDDAYDESNKTRQRVFNRSNGYTQIAGGTITTEQIQDATRSLIIDFQSNPPRIIARNGAKIIGNIEFSLTDENIQQVLDKIGVIGGENLVDGGTFSHTYASTEYLYIQKLLTLTKGEKYIATYGSLTCGNVSNDWASGVCLIVSTASYMYADVLSSYTIDGVYSFGEVIEVTGSGRYLHLAWGVKSYVQSLINGSSIEETSGSFTLTITSLMVQLGSTPTTYAPYIEHLTSALKGTTTVAGGLLMTNLLQLLNEGNQNTAGLSGLSDNVLLWGGCTYAQALAAAALNPNSVSAAVEVLLRKDGLGKIGIFRINQDNIVIKTDNGFVVLDDDEGLKCYDDDPDDDGKLKVVVTPKEIETLAQLEAKGITVTDSDGCTYDNTLTKEDRDNTGWNGDLNITNTFTVYCGKSGTVSVYLNNMNYDVLSGSGYTLNAQGSEYYAYVTVTDATGAVQTGTLNDNNRYAQSFNISYAGNVTVQVVFAFFVYLRAGGYIDLKITGSCGVGSSYREYPSYTMIGKGGFYSYLSGDNYIYYKDSYGLECRVGDFYIKLNSSNGIQLLGIQQGDTGLTAGSGIVYKDSNGYLKVK